MNLKLKIALLESGYARQADFAQKIGAPESFVSNVLHHRKKLSKEQSKTWQKILKCKPKLLRDITI